MTSFYCFICAGAINQLTKNLACEWAKDNIRTNTVAPWAVKTTIQGSVRSFKAFTTLLHTTKGIVSIHFGENESI